MNTPTVSTMQPTDREQHEKLRHSMDRLAFGAASPLELLAAAKACVAPSITFDHDEEPGLVSVVMPSYNSREFIERSIRSVWEQSLEPGRIELIVVDDESTDDSMDSIHRLQSESPVEMKRVTHPKGINRGVAATRNLGFRHARGAAVALLDADDRYLPERLQRSVDYLEAHPDCGCLCSFGTNVDESGDPVTGYNNTTIAGSYAAVSDLLHPPFTFDQLWRAYPIANSSITMRRSTLARSGGYPDVMAYQSEDWYLMLVMSLDGPIHCLEEPLMEYTNHERSYTRRYHDEELAGGARHEVFWHVLNWMLKHPDHLERGNAFYRHEFWNLGDDNLRPNLTHIPVILRNAFRRFFRIGPAASLKMVRDTWRHKGSSGQI